MLLRTSLVDRMNGELADLLADRAGSEQILLGLEDANAFVVSLDAQRTWFRYHQLLADFLRLELRRTLAEEVPDLHRRAARWFADRGEVVEAVRQTLAAGDWPDAARLVADHSFRWVLDGEAGTIRAVLQAFPEGASADHPDLALAHAAAELNQGRLEEAAGQLALAEAHVQSAPPARRRRLAVAIASLRLALARRSGQFSEVIEQVNLLDASIADESSEPIAMGSELRGVALLNLGIVETWSGRLADAERHLSEGAALAQTIGRPYLEVACRAHQGFPSKLVSVATARERGRQAVALAERHGLDDRPILAPALGRLAAWRSGWASSTRESAGCAAPGRSPSPPSSRPPQCFCTWQRGCCTPGAGSTDRRSRHSRPPRRRSRSSQASTLLRRGSPDGSRPCRLASGCQTRRAQRSADSPPTPERLGALGAIGNARAVISITEGDPAAALDALGDVLATTPRLGPAFTLAEAHLLAGIAHLSLGDRNRRRRRGRGSARGRRAGPADLPVRSDRGRRTPRRAPASRNGSRRPSRRRRRRVARRAGAEQPSESPSRSPRSSARASCASCAICRRT